MSHNKLTILTAQEHQRIMAQSGASILFFTDVEAENCQMALVPLLEIRKRYCRTVGVYSCDIDVMPLIAMKHGIINIPCMVFVKDGKEQARLVGIKKYYEIEEMIKKCGVTI